MLQLTVLADEQESDHFLRIQACWLRSTDCLREKYSTTPSSCSDSGDLLQSRSTAVQPILTVITVLQGKQEKVQ